MGSWPILLSAVGVGLVLGWQLTLWWQERERRRDYNRRLAASIAERLAQ